MSAAAQPRERAESIWPDTFAQQGAYVFVSDDNDRIAATGMLITAPNLLREGRRHGFLENVVSHAELRGGVTARLSCRPPWRMHGRSIVTTC